MMRQAISRNAAVLTTFALGFALILGVTEWLTREPIATARRAAEARAYEQILPHTRYDNVLLDDVITLADRKLLGLRAPRNALVARMGGRVEAVILPFSAADGYGGAIDMIAAVNADGTIAGVRTVAHHETPGLGDRIERRKSDWIESFRGRSLADPPPARWTVRKDGGDFDQFTGATITPRAVTAAVRRALQYFEANRATLTAPRAAENRNDE